MKKIAGLLVIGGLILWSVIYYKALIGLIGYIFGLFMPLIIGICIAFILNVLLRFIEEKIFIHIDRRVDKEKRLGKIWTKAVRPLSLILSVFLALALVTAIVILIIPELKNTIEVLIDEFPGYVTQMQSWLESGFSIFGVTSEQIDENFINWDEVTSSVSDFFTNNGRDLVGSALGVTTSVFSGITNAILGFVFAMYILVKKEKLVEQSKKVIMAYLPKERAEDTISIGALTNRIFSGFVSGEFMEACILGILTFIGMTIFGFPYAAMISALIGFTALIPIVGAFIGVIVGTFLILMQDPISALWFLVFILILQQIESNLIYPRVVGKSIGLPGIWVLLAVLVGGSLAGIVGMLIGVPFASVLYALLQRSVNTRLKKKNLKLEDLEIEDLRE